MLAALGGAGFGLHVQLSPAAPTPGPGCACYTACRHSFWLFPDLRQIYSYLQVGLVTSRDCLEGDSPCPLGQTDPLGMKPHGPLRGFPSNPCLSRPSGRPLGSGPQIWD